MVATGTSNPLWAPLGSLLWNDATILCDGVPKPGWSNESEPWLWTGGHLDLCRDLRRHLGKKSFSCSTLLCWRQCLDQGRREVPELQPVAQERVLQSLLRTRPFGLPCSEQWLQSSSEVCSGCALSGCFARSGVEPASARSRPVSHARVRLVHFSSPWRGLTSESSSWVSKVIEKL